MFIVLGQGDGQPEKKGFQVCHWCGSAFPGGLPRKPSKGEVQKAYIAKLSQLAPSGTEEHWFYSDLSTDDQSPHPIPSLRLSQAAPLWKLISAA